MSTQATRPWPMWRRFRIPLRPVPYRRAIRSIRPEVREPVRCLRRKHAGQHSRNRLRQNCDQFLRQQIFEPLGMKDIFFHPGEDGPPRTAISHPFARRGRGRACAPAALVAKATTMTIPIFFIAGGVAPWRHVLHRTCHSSITDAFYNIAARCVGGREEA